MSGYGGRTTSPIVDGDLVILGMLNASWGYQGMGRNRFVAFNKKTGSVVWWASGGFPPKNTYYSIPVVGGDRRRSGCSSAAAATAAFTPSRSAPAKRCGATSSAKEDVNCSPVVSGNLVYIGHGETNDDSPREGRIICVDGSIVENGKPKLVWKKDGIRVKFASPILDKDRLYVCNDTADLYCLNARRMASNRGKSSTARTPKARRCWPTAKSTSRGVDGEFQILKPGDDDCEILHTHQFEGAQVKGSPIAVNGKVYFMTTTTTYCLGKKGHTAKADAIPPAVKEPPSPRTPNRPTFKFCPRT